MVSNAAQIDASMGRLERNRDVRRWREEYFSHEAGLQRKADIVVRSADGWPYPTRRLHLAYGSEVFSDLLATCDDVPSLDGKLEVLQVDERAEDGLDVFMSFVTPGALFAAPWWGIDNLLKRVHPRMFSSVARC